MFRHIKNTDYEYVCSMKGDLFVLFMHCVLNQLIIDNYANIEDMINKQRYINPWCIPIITE